MYIDSFIDRGYVSVSILEPMHQVAEWLLSTDYLAVIDEELRAVGIVTIKDAHYYPYKAIIDCDIFKPHTAPNFTLIETFRLMMEANTDCLPVYEHDKFVGVISLKSITAALIKTIPDQKQTRIKRPGIMQ